MRGEEEEGKERGERRKKERREGRGGRRKGRAESSTAPYREELQEDHAISISRKAWEERGAGSCRIRDQLAQEREV